MFSFKLEPQQWLLRSYSVLVLILFKLLLLNIYSAFDKLNTFWCRCLCSMLWEYFLIFQPSTQTAQNLESKAKHHFLCIQNMLIFVISGRSWDSPRFKISQEIIAARTWATLRWEYLLAHYQKWMKKEGTIIQSKTCSGSEVDLARPTEYYHTNSFVPKLLQWN